MGMNMVKIVKWCKDRGAIGKTISRILNRNQLYNGIGDQENLITAELSDGSIIEILESDMGTDNTYDEDDDTFEEDDDAVGGTLDDDDDFLDDDSDLFEDDEDWDELESEDNEDIEDDDEL